MPLYIIQEVTLGMEFAQRTKTMEPSMTMAITNKAKQMKDDGIDVVGFGAGEPDFPTPENICDAAIKAIRDGFTRYTASAGIPELREAVCEKLLRDNGLQYRPNEIVVGVGAKDVLYNIFQVLLNAGDEVIIPVPYWVSYPEQVKLAGGKPIFIQTSQDKGFRMTPDDLAASLTAKTKAVVMNSPSNPTGSVYSESELLALAAVLEGKDIYVISDEIYEKIIYDGNRHVSIASLSPELKEKTIVVNGMSKTYSMTGWRIGYSACEGKLAKVLADLSSQSISNADSIAQKAAVEAYRGPQDSVEKMRIEFEKRRNYICERLNGMPGITCRIPEGAFYVFPDISGLLGKKINGKPITDSLSCAAALLDEARVAVVPGIGFGAENYLRLSYAMSMDDIVKGMDRVSQLLTNIG